MNNIKSMSRVTCSSSFYKSNDLYKFNNKNVVYIADVGKYNNEHIFKYGISGKVFDREYNAHRKNFDYFDMKVIKITDNKDIIEELFEKELLIRNVHRSLIINKKKQTELFTINENYSFSYFQKLLNRLVKNNPSYEVSNCKKKIIDLEMQIKKLKQEQIINF
jgi:3-methyladenine DNA glycosylase Tag